MKLLFCVFEKEELADELPLYGFISSHVPFSFILLFEDFWGKYKGNKSSPDSSLDYSEL